MTERIGRRGFLGKAAPAALAVPLLSQGARANSLGPSPGLQGGATSKVKKIAVEEHCTFDTTAEAAGRPKNPRQADLGEVRLAAMDEAGVTMQVITNSGVQFIPDASKAVELSKRNNELLAEACSKHPDRLVACFAALPTQDPQAAIDEFERAVTKLKFKGAVVEGFPPGVNDGFLDTQKFLGLWERSAALGAPIYIHPAQPPADGFKMITESGLTSLAWAGGVFCATQALRLMVNGVFDAYPKAILMLGHNGELLPYWLGRLDDQTRSKTMKKKPSDYARENLLVATSGLYRPEAVVCAMSALGDDRVLFATDYASVSGKVAVELVEKVPISAADKERIYHLNAEKWLRI